MRQISWCFIFALEGQLPAAGKVFFHKKQIFDFLLVVGPNWAPSWPQVGPMLAPRWPQGGPKWAPSRPRRFLGLPANTTPPRGATNLKRRFDFVKPKPLQEVQKKLFFKSTIQIWARFGGKMVFPQYNACAEEKWPKTRCVPKTTVQEMKKTFPRSSRESGFKFGKEMGRKKSSRGTPFGRSRRENYFWVTLDAKVTKNTLFRTREGENHHFSAAGGGCWGHFVPENGSNNDRYFSENINIPLRKTHVFTILERRNEFEVLRAPERRCRDLLEQRNRFFLRWKDIFRPPEDDVGSTRANFGDFPAAGE